VESKLTPGFYTRTGSTQAGLVEKDLAAADGEGDFGEGRNVLSWVGGEDHEVPSMPLAKRPEWVAYPSVRRG
jgi:hypothetical protein